jgi:hypothetical protein
MVITFHETNNFIKNSIVYYNCDFLLEQMPVQSKVNDIGDLTLLDSNQFNETSMEQASQSTRGTTSTSPKLSMGVK